MFRVPAVVVPSSRSMQVTGKHEDQRDEPGQTRARQILRDVELAEVLFQQTAEAQAAKPAS